MTLVLLPAVDVAAGRAVRLVQGEAGSETEYGEPGAAALQWQRDGASWVHLVDLDAAFGRGSNRDLLADVVGRLDVEVELSGGIRDDATLAAALSPSMGSGSPSGSMSEARRCRHAGGRRTAGNCSRFSSVSTVKDALGTW
jgi:phosphoribosylformimino-5-aminoimidazole carboxamide ribonucleotide (ProFAR) isomerase